MFGKYIKLDSKITKLSENIIFAVLTKELEIAKQLTEILSGAWRVVENGYFKDKETGRNVFLLANKESEKRYLIVDENGEIIAEDMPYYSENEAKSRFKQEYDEYVEQLKLLPEDIYELLSLNNYMLSEDKEEFIEKTKTSLNEGEYNHLTEILEVMVKDDNACAKEILWRIEESRFYKYS